MFDGQSSNQEFNVALEGSLSESPSLEMIIQRCVEIPAEVRAAKINKTFERLLDESELDRLTNPLSIPGEDVEEVDRLLHRRKILRSKLGSTLSCVLIRLPGVCYTIEIDPVEQSVVHWEWNTQ